MLCTTLQVNSECVLHYCIPYTHRQVLRIQKATSRHIRGQLLNKFARMAEAFLFNDAQALSIDHQQMPG